MKRKIFFAFRGKSGCALLILCMLPPILYCAMEARSNNLIDPLFQLITPAENSEIIAKRPLVKCSIGQVFKPEDILILLDETDITGVLNITSEGFEYKPLQSLSPGLHTLRVTLRIKEGEESKKEFKFSTRHSKAFEEAYSNNEITTLHEQAIDKDKDLKDVSSWKLESNLKSESKLKEKGWEFKFNTNVRYFDQNLSVTTPIEKGFNLANYLFQGEYTSNKFHFLTEIGDVQINETLNTVQGLARRGGNLVFQFKDLHLQLRTFAVNSEQFFGFKGGLGLEGKTDNHIMGISGDLGLLSERVKLKTIYVRGGEEDNSLGVSTTGGKKKGDVLGFLFSTDFFKQKLTTEAELDLSRFDPDTSDKFHTEHDKAYRFKVGGTSGNYTYGALYEYMGPDYEVIGNPCLQKNREGAAVNAGASFQNHTINLSLSRYNDNVTKDDLYPVTYTSQGTVDYTFNKIKELPIGFSYQKSRIESKNEPLNTLPIKTDTDAVTGRINFIQGPWNLGFMSSYSQQNDQTSQDNDTTTLTHTLMSAYSLEHITISPSFSFNRSRTHLTNIRTDTYTTALDLRGDLFQKKVTYGLAGTYNILRASDDTTKQDTVNSNFNVSYLLAKNLWGFLSPSVGIRGIYNSLNKMVNSEEHHEFAILLVLSTGMSFSF